MSEESEGTDYQPDIGQSETTRWAGATEEWRLGMIKISVAQGKPQQQVGPCSPLGLGGVAIDGRISRAGRTGKGRLYGAYSVLVFVIVSLPI